MAMTGERGVILEQQRDAVAGLQAGAEEPVRDALRAFVQRLVGDDLVECGEAQGFPRRCCYS